MCGCPDTCHTNASEHMCDEIGGDVWIPHLSLHPHTYSAGVASTVHAHTHTAQGCPKIHFSLSLSCEMRYLSLWRVGGGSIEPFVFISIPHKFIPKSIFPPSSIHPSLLLSSSPSSCVKGVVHYELKSISLIMFGYSCRYNLGKGICLCGE